PICTVAPCPLHSTRAGFTRIRPRGNTSVRPARLATTLLYGQYAPADGGVALGAGVVAEVAGAEIDDRAAVALVEDLARWPPPQATRSAAGSATASARTSDSDSGLRTSKASLGKAR